MDPFWVLERDNSRSFNNPGQTVSNASIIIWRFPIEIISSNVSGVNSPAFFILVYNTITVLFLAYIYYFVKVGGEGKMGYDNKFQEPSTKSQINFKIQYLNFNCFFIEYYLELDAWSLEFKFCYGKY